MKRISVVIMLVLLPVWAFGDTLALDCASDSSLSSFVEIVRGKNITGDTLIIADKDICAREMIRVVTDEEGNVIRPAILGCFQFNGDKVSIFVGQRIITGKTAISDSQLTITDIADGGAE